MPAYPPPIRSADYAPPIAPPLEVIAPCPEPAEVELLDLGLEACRGASFAAPHDDLASDAGQRFRFAPGAEEQPITWRIRGAGHVRAARFDIFYRTGGALTRIWTKTVAWDLGRCPGSGFTSFRGLLAADEHGRVASGSAQVDIVFAGDALFPGDHLNAQQAPYLLVMTIVSVEAAHVVTQRRWIYVDVVVADIRLSLGAAAFIPAVAAVNAHGFNQRNQWVHGQLDAQLDGHALASGTNASILLEGNCFSAHDGDMDNQSSSARWVARWRDGPYLPVVARVRVRASGGQAVDAPDAVRGCAFVWDWHGRDAFDAGDLPPLARGSMRDAYDMCFEMHRVTLEKAGYNTSERYGGRIGVDAALFKHGDTGHTRYVDGGDGEFPFPMEELRNRKAVASFVRADGRLPSQTGVVFTPSIVSEDRYKLSVYFAYRERGEWDVAPTRVAHDLPYETPRATTGWLTVKRKVRIARTWKMPRGAGVGAFTIDRLVREFAGSGIVFDVADAAPRDISADHFRTEFDAEEAALTPKERLMIAPRGEQAGSGYALKLRTYDEACALALQEYRRHLATYGGKGVVAQKMFAYGHAWAVLAGNDGMRLQAGISYGNLPNPPAGDDLDMAEMILGPIPLIARARTAANETAIKALIVEALTDATSADTYRNGCKDLVMYPVQHISGRLVQRAAPDEKGLHLFLYEFENNLEMFSASGWAFDSPSNAARCHECNAVLTADAKRTRTCQACAAVLDEQACIETLVPLGLVRSIGLLDVAGNLSGLARLVSDPENPQNEALAKRFTLQSMPGVRAEVLVAHEMGHQLFLPHAPFGFDRRDVDPHDASGFVQGQVLAKFLQAYDGSEPLRDKLGQATAPGGAKDSVHASDNRACMMGYNFAALAKMHFCTKCLLRMRGWDSGRVEMLP